MSSDCMATAKNENMKIVRHRATEISLFVMEYFEARKALWWNNAREQCRLHKLDGSDAEESLIVAPSVTALYTPPSGDKGLLPV